MRLVIAADKLDAISWMSTKAGICTFGRIAAALPVFQRTVTKTIRPRGSSTHRPPGASLVYLLSCLLLSHFVHDKYRYGTMNKNWNDRADKDLFFTILSVKNIGVISGAEWTTIGNHMRSLGYGFTNEGCRQHFQGLRRAQNKAEADGTHTDSARRADPTLNPITRRPGPGRGRPRKSQAPDQGQPDVDADASPTELSPDIPTTISATVPAVLPGAIVSSPMPGQGPGMSSPIVPIQQQQHQQVQPQHQHQFQQQQFQQQLQQHQVQLQPQLKTEIPDADGIPVSSQTSNHIVSNHLVGSEPGSATPQEQLELDAVHSGDDDADEHPAKRQRLDPHGLAQDSALDDEAVLALAAHNGTDATDPYPPDFGYREA
ncbi:hypothetical protein TARUN_1227 [Trichoderma arundinaceum]|uniref:Myb-like domain-containing protein n=1 Tax=Trichoderma arundinaceum TaxID=490622 RepID=A0A395NXV5_TRIAR|nr:hypothetical protein TARUN_1227 [Trichoderma arundinaceum]